MRKTSVLGSAASPGRPWSPAARLRRAGRRRPPGHGDDRVPERLEGRRAGRPSRSCRRAASKVEVWIENATPGTHGLHIHEKGDCSAPDATSAGGHFNAAGNPHAGPTDAAHHNGDLGNIEIGADGKGHLEITSDLLTVKPGPELGRRQGRHLPREGRRSEDAADRQRGRRVSAAASIR